MAKEFASSVVSQEQALHALASRGDSIIIRGDPERVRALGWDVLLRDPNDPASFHAVAGKDPDRTMPWIVRHAAQRQSAKIYIAADTLEDTPVREAVTLPIAPAPLNHKEYSTKADALRAYVQAVEDERVEGERVTHVFDLHRVIDVEDIPELEATGAPRRTYRSFNGFYAVDRGDRFKRLTAGEVSTPDFSGHQASIHRANGSLVKGFVDSPEHRLNTPAWQEAGGYRGVEEVIQLVTEYRERLRALGFPVPTEGAFLPARKKDGTFFALEVVPFLGQDLQHIFLAEDWEMKAEAVKEMLDASYPVLTTAGIGADLKPANWVRSRDGLVHIDPLPPLMKHAASEKVYTEWPPIEEPSIQDFLAETHLTEKAIGYRFYQELCQIDPMKRSEYQTLITQKLREWEEQGRMSAETVEEVINAMEPTSPRVLKAVITGETDAQSGFAEIDATINALSEPGSHPIYALREMAFLETEHILKHNGDLDSACSTALQAIRDNLGEKKAAAIAAAIENVPSHLRLLTIIRKVTSLSNHHWKADENERTALVAIEAVAQGLIYGHNTR